MIYKSIITCIFHSIDLFTLYLCVYFVSLLDRFCSFLSLFESTFILSTHTLQCKRCLISNIKSNQSLCILLLNIYAIYIIRYKYIYLYQLRCTVVLRPRVTRPTEIACLTMAHASRQGKYPSITTLHPSSAAQTAIVHVYSLLCTLLCECVC